MTKHFSSTKRYQIGELVRVPDYGMCKIVYATWLRGMYHYACHEV